MKFGNVVEISLCIHLAVKEIKMTGESLYLAVT